MSAPVATERKSFLPLRLRSTTVVGSSNIPTSIPIPMSLGVQNDSKISLTVGDRVLVNGLKIGTLRYKGTVKFAQGLFYGVELDEPEGKHDGQVNDFRYFQCKTNHGVFVPYDKVVLAPRERILPRHRTISRLKPPTVSRAMTVTSSTPVNNRIEIPVKISTTHIQLPDIIPSPLTPTQPISIVKEIDDSTNTDDYEVMTLTEESRIIYRPVIHHQPLAIDEPPETIEADFTDSVSLILHQLQQEQQISLIQSQSSTTISEGSIVDDDEDDDIDTDDLDNESIAESNISDQIQMIRRLSSINESTKSVQTDLSFDINDNIFISRNNFLDLKSLSNSNQSLASSTASINKLKTNTTDNKMNTNKKRTSIPTSITNIKQDSERTLANNSNTTRRSSLIPSKKGSTSTLRQNSLHAPGLLSSQSKLNSSLSSTNSINKSHSDLLSNQQKSASSSTRTISQSDKKSNLSSHSLNTFDLQKLATQSSENNKEQYRYLLNQFDIMCILSQYYINENEQLKQQNELKLSKFQIANKKLKTVIEQLKTSHKKELIILNEQHQKQIDIINELHKKQIIDHQQQIDQLLNEKIQLQTQCTSLQEQVDRFNEEMANSEYADPLLRRVEILEKDRSGLQTVLEIRNQELTQLRTKMNEQVFEREDQLALQKRIDMAENRNQDLVCLLRNWQLNEKAAAVERDQLKEQLAQLERDNRQLTFENETLFYRVRQQSISSPLKPTLKFDLNINSTQNIRDRAQSFSSILINSHEKECLPRSLSLNSF
ncbi:unnamed protein product [Adineta steineri]|uniref:CAP-Gly domain-containing protein n=2 Tax=Adineta steineri TaxID=433720 RepID=A0A819CV61_9BILA|nr:unnamed protein product [Adineta steineri]CAF3823968.1 unnamed protein product [Adineta steineri]